MRKMPPVLRLLFVVFAIVAAMTVIAAAFLIAGDDATDATPDQPATSVATSEDESVADIAEQFRQAVNARGDERVAELAPTTSEGTLEFLIGGGPYEKVDCYTFNGNDECRVVNGIADFTFTVDAASATVTEITYVGGE